MHPILTQALDRLIIRLACAAQPKAGTYPGNVAAARELLKAPDFFGEATPASENVTWTSETDFHFLSPTPCKWQENNIVFAQLFRCAADWAKHPTVILLHGWNDEIGYHFRHPFQTRRLLRAGFNVATIQLPFHLKRRPRGPGAVRDFLSEDLHSTVGAAHQAIADIRSLIAWLNGQGCTGIGLWGVSLGGWLTGLLSCIEDRVRFAVLTVPVSRMDLVIKDLPFCQPIRNSLKNETFDLERLNLRNHRPKMSPPKILVVEAVDDLFASKEAIEEFCQVWNVEHLWRIHHAHISGLFSLPLMNRTVRWISEAVQT